METSSSDRTPPIDAMAPECLETALFALGDPRDVEARLGLVRGVWRTCVGYAGVVPGQEGDPEAVLVEYAPQSVSYGQLLELLLCWYGSGPAEGERAAIFYRTAQERRLAQAAVERGVLLGTPRAHVLPFKTFRRAGNACQKYYLHVASWLYADLMALYGGEDALIHSTLAARLNGFLRQPSRSALRCLPESADLYGLSFSDRQALRALAV